MCVNLETVISDSKLLSKDLTGQHQSSTVLDVPPCSPVQDSAALPSSLNFAKVKRPRQRYGLFLFFQVKYTAGKYMNANPLGKTAEPGSIYVVVQQ